MMTNLSRKILPVFVLTLAVSMSEAAHLRSRNLNGIQELIDYNGLRETSHLKKLNDDGFKELVEFSGLTE